MNISDLHQLFLDSSAITTDTKKIVPESIFFALKGERFDANTFANEALSKGASHVVIDNKKYFIDHRTILVSNVLQTLQALALYHRQYLGLPIIALTGSNGKTTTKELINVVLQEKYNTTCTVGNLNNHIGVPLTVLSFTHETEIGVVEMGANHQKEIEFLCKIAEPDFGYITNFGKAHLEGFGGVEGVVKGKSELYTYLKDAKKTAIVNLDDSLQVEKSRDIELYTFTTIPETAANVVIKSVTANPFVHINIRDITIKSNLVGSYNASNICAAVAIGQLFGVADLQIKEAIEKYVPENNRSQLLERNSNHIILDAYNANPSSMSAAIQHFLAVNQPNKVLVLGDMFELGDESSAEHLQIVELLKNQKDIQVYFIGPDFYAHEHKSDIASFYATFNSFIAAFKVAKGSTILIKGSRGMALERTLDLI